MKRPFYTEEFKIKAAKQVVEQGFTCTEVASRVGMLAQSLSNGITKYHGANSRGLKKDQKIVSKDDEIRRLKVELKQAKMERDILKKAAAFFANHPE